MVAVGDLLLEKYKVERELGRGGMGFVVAARHVVLDELVAIKMVLPEHAQTDEVVRRFMREARAAAKISSEHVVRVSDVGRLPSGEPYMVMEMLQGEDLEAHVRGHGRLSVTDAVDYVMQALEAVAEAHASGIVHRDLKPANLFLAQRRDGTRCVKVLDFGISKLATSDVTAGAAMTATQGLLGSPLYMSPEQLQSARDVDGRSDIWSFGVILHQLLSGVLPFNADTLPQLVVKVLASNPTPLRLVRSDAPEGLEIVIRRCLTGDRAQRPQTVAELAGLLASFGGSSSRESLTAIETLGRGGAPVRIHTHPPRGDDTALGLSPTVQTDGSKVSTVSNFGGTQPPAPSRNRTPFLVGGALLAIIAVAGAAFSLGARRDPPQAAPAAPASAATTPAATTIAPAPTPAPSAIVSSEPTASASVAASKPSAAPTPVAPKAKQAPTAAPTPVVKTAPKAACDPPFTFDAKGNKVFKPECL